MVKDKKKKNIKRSIRRKKLLNFRSLLINLDIFKRISVSGLILIMLLELISSLFWFPIQKVYATEWFNSSWRYRKNIIIDHTKVDGETLINFPVLINITDTDLRDDAQEDGDDIIFIDAEGSQLDHEIEYFDTTDGNLMAWVRIPSLSYIEDTIIQMYYGNTNATSSQNMTGVWDENYVMVQHLQETDIDGDAGDIKDSTIYGNNGTTVNLDTADQVLGQIDGSFDFDGSDDYVYCSDPPSLNITNQITVSAWIKGDVFGSRNGIVGHSTASPRWGLMQDDNGAKRLRVFIYYASSYKSFYSTTVLNTDTWYFATFTHTSDWGTRLYVNGVEENSNVKAESIGRLHQPTLIGNYGSGSSVFDGSIDEVQISNTSRSAGWIGTSYENQKNPNTFYSVGEEQSISSIQFTSISSTGLESEALIQLELTLSFIFEEDVNVDYAVTGGTALGAGTDYILADGTATITAGSATTTIDATIINDDLDESDETIIVTISNPVNASLGDNTVYTYTIQDDDIAGITVNPTSGLTTDEAGGTDTFTVVLDSEPTADVFIGLSSNNIAEGIISTSSLTFTSANWNIAQTATVVGVDDDIDDGDIGYAIITAIASSSDDNYNIINPSDVSATNADDNDTAGITVNPTSGLTTDEAGGTDIFTVVLDSEPTADVFIGLSSNNTAEGIISTSSLTFTSANWNIAQTATVIGVDDNIDDGDIGYAIITAIASSSDDNYNIINPSDVSATNADDDLASSGGGGGLPPGAYIPPIPPSGGFSILIQPSFVKAIENKNGLKYINNRIVTLKLNGGYGGDKMSISNNSDFIGASIEDYKAQKQWDLCSKNGDLIQFFNCSEGIYTVYVKFYTQYGQPSEVISDTIILDTKPPEIKITEIKDYYISAEDVNLIAETEAEAEIILRWDKQYRLIKADNQGNLIINLGKMSAGNYQLEMTPTDLAGNIGKILLINLIIRTSAEVPEAAPEVVSEIYKDKPVEQKSEKLFEFMNIEDQKPIIEQLKSLIPEFLKPKEEKKEKPEEIIIPEETPLAMSGQWKFLIEDSIKNFILAPLPQEIRKLAEKFPKFGETLRKVGITKIADLQKLKTIKLTLPGLTERVGLPIAKIESGKFALPDGIPLAKLTPEDKKQIPSEIIFAKTGGDLIDFNIDLIFDEKGNPQQKISTISGKDLQLVVKPDKPVKSVKGYIVFKSKIPEETSLRPTKNFLSKSDNKILFSEIFNWVKFPVNCFALLDNRIFLRKLADFLILANPALAHPQEKSIQVEEKLVLLEFEYTDPDGDGIYTAEIQAPLVEGEHEIITVMDFEDPELGQKEISLITVVDPEGYIYTTLPAGELRIAGAIISIYWLNPETKKYELWPAKEYQQENPQSTDDTGQYFFLVPPGTYYLKVEHPKYPIYQSETFIVKEGLGIHMNIELKTKYWWLKVVDWKVIAMIIFGILLLYNFYRDKIREKFLNKSKKL